MTIQTFLPECAAAEFLGISAKTLQRLRGEGSGPSFCKLNRRVVYHAPDLTAWALARRRQSTSADAGEVHHD